MYSLTLNLNNVELEHTLQQIAEKEGKNAPEIILMAVQQFIQQYQASVGGISKASYTFL